MNRRWFALLAPMAFACAIAGCTGNDALKTWQLSTRQFGDVTEGDIVARRVGNGYMLLRVSRLADVELLMRLEVAAIEGVALDGPAFLRQVDATYEGPGQPTFRALLGRQTPRTYASLSDGYRGITAKQPDELVSDVCWIVPDDPSDDFVVIVAEGQRVSADESDKNRP